MSRDQIRRMMELATEKDTRKVLSSRDDFRTAVSCITGVADRALAILTPDLEPEVYDHDDFLEALKRFILARSFARVRVLISNPSRALKTGNRFVDMGRRLNSYIEFRHVKEEYRTHTEAFCIADDVGIVFRADGEKWEGMSDTSDPAMARKYLDMFDELWVACEVESELRQLHL